jgi:predicted membrane-bound spermidine synthase
MNRINISLMMSAAAGLIYEIVATNLLFFYFIESTYSIAIVLSTFLMGLGIGSYIIYKFKDIIIEKERLFATIQISICIYALLILTNLTKIIPTIGMTGIIATSFVILLIPSILLGASFPLVGLILNKKESTGLVYSIDLIGAVAGSVLAGFILIPAYGNVFAVQFAASLNLMAGLIAFAKSKKVLVFLSIVIIAALFFIPQQEYVDEENYVEKNSPYGEVKYEIGRLYINGREQCWFKGNHSQEGETKIVDYSLTPLGSKDIDVVNIGLGCGNTLQQIADAVNSNVDIVEINPAVVEINREHSEVLLNPNINLIIDEGLHYLKTTDKKYDSIIIDIENPAIIHASNIYTQEAFNTIYYSLKDKGTFGLWTYRCGSEEYYDIIYYTLKSIFPYVYKMNDNNYIASKFEIEEYEGYKPSTNKKINTINHKVLSEIYLEECKWW